MKKQSIFALSALFALYLVATLPACTGPAKEGANNEQITETVQESTKDASEPTQEPTTEPSTEPTKEPNSEPTAEPASEPTTEPKSEPTTEPQDEPSSEPVVDDAIEPAIVPSAERIAEVMDAGTEAPPEMLTEQAPEVTTCSTFSYKGTVYDFFGNNQPKITAVNVCAIGSVGCKKSNIRGEFTLTGLKVNTDIYISLKKSGWSNVLLPLHVQASALNANCQISQTLGMVSTQQAAALASSLGVNQSANRSTIVATVSEPGKGPLSGAKMTITPKKGAGPYYITAAGRKNIRPETASTGLAVFLNIPVGTYSVGYSHSSKTCEASPYTIQNATGDLSVMKITATGGPWMVLTSGICQ